jgi:hypothetical protein
VRGFDVDLIFERRILFRPLDFRFADMIERRRATTMDLASAGRQSSFGRHSGQRDKRIKENRTARQKSPGLVCPSI